MNISLCSIVGLLAILLLVPSCLSRDREFTIKIPPGARSCFYHAVEEIKEFELEFQVIEGGELDINLVIRSPSDAIIFSVHRKSDGIHKIIPASKGDHMLCFDNTFSSITEKLVFFALIDDSSAPMEDDWSRYGEDIDLEVKVEDIRAAVTNVHRNLERTVQLQNILRVNEARDRAIQEANCDRVNNWSMIQLVIMFSVASLQIFLIRSLFEEKSKVNQLFKKAAGHS